MRAFLGISIPDKLKPKITRIQDKFDDFDIKFVEKGNLHFNLKFFRYIELDKIEKLKEILKKISAQYEPFEIEISGLGAFPSKNYVRVIWLGVKQGYQTFKSLGRVRSGRNKNELLVLLRKLEDIEIGKMKIEKITLFQSKLSPKGPVYEEVFSVKL
jgi:2'-5' RNA ligase